MNRARLLAGIGAATLLGPSHAFASLPFVPLYGSVYVWDDHYFAWLPTHPVYESFEIMTVRRGPEAPAFFLQRCCRGEGRVGDLRRDALRRINVQKWGSSPDAAHGRFRRHRSASVRYNIRCEHETVARRHHESKRP